MNAKLLIWIVIFAFLASQARAVDTAIPFIQADDVHALGILGQKVVVAVVDTGVDYGDPDLQGKTAPRGVSFVDQTGVPAQDGGADPPGAGHGTLVSLIITDPSGVAPRAKILPIRVQGPSGSYARDVARALDCASQHSAGHPTRQEGSQESANDGCLPHSTRAGTGIRSWLRLHGLRGTQPAAVASEW